MPRFAPAAPARAQEVKIKLGTVASDMLPVGSSQARRTHIRQFRLQTVVIPT